MAETQGLLVSRVGRDFALAVLESFDSPSFSVVRVDEETELAALKIIQQYSDKPFSFVDATSFLVMEALGLRTAFTFDDHFSQYGFATL